MNSYLDRIQKAITLPSGYHCTVRRQTQLDAIEIGSAPGFFFRNLKLKERGQPEQEETDGEREAMMKFMARQNRVILTRCVVGHLIKDDELWLISEAEPGKEEPGTISWALIEQPDVDAIIAASNELSGFTPAGREAAKTFPEQPENAGDNGHPVPSLRLPANGPSPAIAHAV